MNRFLKIIDKPMMLRTAVTLGALLPISLGAAWICAFGFNHYRPEMASMGVTAGILTLLYGVILFCMYRWAIFISFFLGLIITVTCLIFIFSSSWVYLFLALFCGLYPIVTGRHIFLWFTGGRAQTQKN